ncbi:aryl-sulfate sulfotransferase [candidate division WOR-3 bacterium]|nr:aryl-sulfate sulfotransferase [candidate division WOR-3 bacterium]
MNKKVLLLLAVLLVTSVTAERTVGLFINEEDAWDGYTMFAPGSYNATYLINNEGELIHSWEYDNGGSPTALTEDGIYYQAFNYDTTHPVFGKALGGVESLDWDGNVLWHYDYWGEDFSRHHDTELLPNGNVIMIAYKLRDSLECIQAGKNPANLKRGKVYADYLVEVEPVGTDQANIVWEWHFWDHVIQDFDETKDNYGVIADHPELIDLNEGEQKEDWPHLNGVYYFEEFDQILVSAGHTSEFYVIDHSTTTEEAREHSGGTYGKGGDFLYRWGNSEMYDQGDSADRKLSNVHSPSVIPDGYPGEGHFMMFSNGRLWGYSSIVEIEPPIDGMGSYSMTGSSYGPDESFWTYVAPVPEDFYANNGGSARRLQNGNTLVGYNPAGEIFEVTDAGEMVWRYVNPVGEDGPVPENVIIENNSIGGAFRFPLDYTAFDGKDMSPKGVIELESIVENEPVDHVDFDISSPVFANSTILSYHVSDPGHVSVKLYNAAGQEVRTLVDETEASGSHTLTWDGRDEDGHRLSAGVYFIKLKTGKLSLKEKIVLTK